LEVSPLFAHDTASTLAAAKSLHAQAGQPNLFIKIPGTKEGLPAIEEAIFAGVPINVTLLFSVAQYRAAAEAYLRGIERRVAAGLDPRVGSVASAFMSRWDKAANKRVPPELTEMRDQLGLAVGRDIYRAYRQVMDSQRWQRLANSGARMQRLFSASTSTKDPSEPDTFYVHGLTAPFTVDTMPDKTLIAFYEHGAVGESMPADGGDSDAVLARFAKAGLDVAALGDELQREGAEAFDRSWRELLGRIEEQVRVAPVVRSAPRRQAHRSGRSRFLEGARALQRRGRSCAQPPSSRAARAVVRVAARAPAQNPVRAARARDGGAARGVRRSGGLRPRVASAVRSAHAPARRDARCDG
jgi:transaldolase